MENEIKKKRYSYNGSKGRYFETNDRESIPMPEWAVGVSPLRWPVNI